MVMMGANENRPEVVRRPWKGLEGADLEAELGRCRDSQAILSEQQPSQPVAIWRSLAVRRKLEGLIGVQMQDQSRAEHERIGRLVAMHANSEHANKPLIVVGEAPHRVLYIANRFVVEFSDDGGLTWVTSPGTENGIETDESQRATLSDYDYPVQFQRLYRTYGLGELAETSPALLHTEKTDYQVIQLWYEILDVPSRRSIADALSEHAVVLSHFKCAVSGRRLTATPSARSFAK